jgi:predicted  nucleic acid-binding Zn-ribbon protein
MVELPDWIRVEMENLKQADQRLEHRLDDQGRRVEDHDRRITQLERDMGEIRTLLGNMATKDDINVSLRGALNAAPAWHTMVWSGALVVITALALFLHK